MYPALSTNPLSPNAELQERVFISEQETTSLTVSLTASMEEWDELFENAESALAYSCLDKVRMGERVCLMSLVAVPIAAALMPSVVLLNKLSAVMLDGLSAVMLNELSAVMLDELSAVMLDGLSVSVIGLSTVSAPKGDSVIVDRERAWLGAAAVLMGLSPSLMYWVRFSRASSRVFWEVEKFWLLTSVKRNGASLGIGETLEGSVSASSRRGRTSLCACLRDLPEKINMKRERGRGGAAQERDRRRCLPKVYTPLL